MEALNCHVNIGETWPQSLQCIFALNAFHFHHQLHLVEYEPLGLRSAACPFTLLKWSALTNGLSFTYTFRIKHTAESKSLQSLTSESVNFEAECLPAITVVANAAFSNLPWWCKWCLRCTFIAGRISIYYSQEPRAYAISLKMTDWLHTFLMWSLMFYMCECKIKDVSCYFYFLFSLHS